MALSVGRRNNTVSMPGISRPSLKRSRTNKTLTFPERVRSLVAECRRYVPELRLGDVERSGHAGVRAQAIARDGSLIDDFVVAETERAVHVRNAPSPAATSALALAEVPKRSFR